LSKGKSGCTILQRAVNKYGIENFIFEVIEITDDYKQREIELLKDGLPPYNSVKETEIRRELSLETRQRLSQIRKGRPAHNKGKKRSKDFNVYRGKLVDIIEDDVTVFTGTIVECGEYLSMAKSSLYDTIRKSSTVKCKYKLKNHEKESKGHHVTNCSRQ